MTKHLSVIEMKILHALSANGGEYLSLFQLAINLECDYKNIWVNTLRLSCFGYLTTERLTTRGRPYRLFLTCGPTWPNALMNPTQEFDWIVGGSNLAGVRSANHKPQAARL